MQDLLEDELNNLGLIPEQCPCDEYLIYIQLLEEWNQTYNLTAIKEPKQIITRHIINSLSVLPYIKGMHCLDVGTGAGLPGIVLALAQPDKKWVLLDNSQKKVRFLRHVKHQLRIDNIEIIRSRIEGYAPTISFDTVICRAFAPLKRLLQQTGHLVTSSNQLLAMKGEAVDDEIQVLTEHNFQIKIFDLPSSDLGAKSKLVKIQKLN
jgi:16S rRNA (guanine527-N7)-methyltransferase